MGLLQETEGNLKYLSEVSTTGLKLLGYTKKMIENMDSIIAMFENMSDEFKGNWINLLGEDSFNKALQFYEAIKQFRQQLKENGLD